MIEIFEGRLGGGKTYSALVRCLCQFKQGGLVCTNVELKWPEIKQYALDKWDGLILEDDQFIKLSDEDIGEFHKYTPSGTPAMNVLVIVDEAHLNFNARDWKDTSKEMLSFLTQSRKVYTDIIFISQSALNMDKQFMRLVQFIWRFRDLARWKIPGLGLTYPFQQILATQYDYDGKTLLQKSFHWKDKRLFTLYNTNSLLREFPRLEDINTKRVLKKTKKEKTSMMKWALLALMVVGIGALYYMKEKTAKDFHMNQYPVATPAPVYQQFRPVTQQSGSAAAERSRKEKMAYDIYDEEFRSYTSEDHVLTTAEGWYQVGEMSNKGLVMGVSSRRARIAQPDGRSGWIVAQEHTAARAEDTAAATPVPLVAGQMAVPAVPRGAGDLVRPVEPAPVSTPVPGAGERGSWDSAFAPE